MDNTNRSGSEPSQSVTPLLAVFSNPRIGTDVIPGSYSRDHMMWMVDTLNGPQPIIDYFPDMAKIITKTKVKAESDDEEISFLPEITTKTDANAEGDDQASVLQAALEATTKTAAYLEKDDTDPYSHGFL